MSMTPSPLVGNDEALTIANVFEALVQRKVNEYFDVVGRPVGEQRSSIYHQIPTDLRECHYAGSRYKHPNPMNVSALKDMLQEWNGILGLLSMIHQQYCLFHEREVETTADLFVIGNAGVFLVDYLAFRRVEPFRTKEIPLLVSGLYKVCLGFQVAGLTMTLEEAFMGKDTPNQLSDSQTFYDYIEERNILIGAKEVCSGPQKLICQAYDAMIGRETHLETTEGISQLQINWDDFIRFASHISKLWLNLSLFVLKLPYFRLKIAPPSLPNALKESINIYLYKSFLTLLQGQSGYHINSVYLMMYLFQKRSKAWYDLQCGFWPPTTHDASSFRTHSDSDQIMKKLSSLFELDPREHDLIAAEVKEQLATYDAFEAVALQALTSDMRALCHSLGYTELGGQLRADDLSSVYGQTLRDLPTVMDNLNIE